MRIDPERKDGKQGRRRDLWQSSLSPQEPFWPISTVSKPIPYRFCTAAQQVRGLPKPVRITHYPGADVLPVFSPDGKKLMWTSTRTANRSSQIFIADFVPPKDE